jgi:2-polyprenyl-6-methoxyphenol hydroxylase-like FAD-dependent oxidoreductase
MKSETEVIIVGAGPTGLSLACQLIRYGIDFVIFDSKPATTPFSKALAVHARTLEIYEQMGLAQTAVERGAIGEKVRLVQSGQVKATFDFSDVGKGLSPYPFVLVLEQSENERLLHEHLQQQGHEVNWNTSYKGLAQTASGVTVTCTGAEGQTHEISGSYVVGCDGAKSQVRHDLGLTFGGSTFERIFYVADVRMDWELPHDGLCVCLGHEAFILFFPMRGEARYRIVGVFPEDAQEKEGAELYQAIEKHVTEQAQLKMDITDVNWFSSYRVHTRRVDRFSSGRGFVAGDAAHIHSPAGGQGMNTGIQDAYNLGWKLASVLRSQAAPALLDSYNEERLENAKHLLETTDRMFQVAAGPDWIISLLRSTIVPPLAGFALGFDTVKKAIFPLLSQIGISYRNCKLSDHAGDGGFEVKAGDRMPYALIDGVSLYDQLHKPKFHLITFSDGKSDHAEIARRAKGDWSALLDYHQVPLYPAIAEIFGSESTFQVLLRPDNYIGLIAAGDKADAVEAYLRRLEMPQSRSA